MGASMKFSTEMRSLRCRTGVSRFVGFGVAILACVCAAATAADPLVSQSQRIPYALTISGGISLGAYEAGVNWGLLRHLRDASEDPHRNANPELVAVTGASAGAINALISAISWCVDPKKAATAGEASWANETSNNLLYQTWTGVGIDQLLPKDKNYWKTDGLFTRFAFRQAIQDIVKTVGLRRDELDKYDLRFLGVAETSGAAIFRDGCEISFGFSVTSETPEFTKLSGLGIPNQRLFVPLSLKVNGGRAAFYSRYVDPTTPGLGNLLFLPPAGRDSSANSAYQETDYEVDNGAVLNAVLASSAFPIAFGRRRIGYCSPNGEGGAAALRARAVAQRRSRLLEKTPAESTRALGKISGKARHQEGTISPCWDGMEPKEGVFLDGGVFDNIPLGAARALAESESMQMDQTAEDAPRGGRRVTYLFMDPDQIRGGSQQASSQSCVSSDRQCANPSSDSVGLSFGLNSQLRFLPGAVDSARRYELFKEMTNGDWTASVAEKTREVIAFIRVHDAYIEGHTSKPACEDFFESLKKYSASPRDFDREISRNKTDLGKWLGTTEFCLDEAAAEYEKALQTSAIPNVKSDRDKRLAALEQVAKLLSTPQLFGSESNPKDVPELKDLLNGMRRAELDRLGDRRIVISSRYFPIVGEYVGGFGAFVDQSFREFDYYVGVYDAIHEIAEWDCLVDVVQADPKCVGGRVNVLYKSFRVDQDQAANFVFICIARQEHLTATESGWEWINKSQINCESRGKGGNSGEVVKAKRFGPVFRALVQELKCRNKSDAACAAGTNTDFDGFLGRLTHDPDFSADANADTLRELLDNREKGRNEWLSAASRITGRMATLEGTEPDHKGYSQVFDALSQVADARLGKGGWGLYSASPSLRKATYYQWLPNEVGYGAVGGGGALFASWEWLFHYQSLDLPIGPQLKLYCGQSCGGRMPDAVQVGFRWFGSVNGFKFGGDLPEVNYLSNGNAGDGRRTGWGWSAFFIPMDWLRITFGERAINGDLVTKNTDFYLDIGIKIDSLLR